MAQIYSATGEAEEALAAATAETVIALIGHTSVKARIVEWGVSFDGTSSSAEPVRIRVVRTTADDGTSTGATEKAWFADAPTPLCTAKHSYSAEPTKESQALAEYAVHPQAGIVIQYPLGREIELDNTTSNGVVIEVTAPATVNCAAYIVWEE